MEAKLSKPIKRLRETMRASLDSLLDAPATAQVRLMQSGVVKPSEILEGYIARVHQNAPI